MPGVPSGIGSESTTAARRRYFNPDYGLTDDPLRPHRWQFPDRLIQPDSFVVVVRLRTRPHWAGRRIACRLPDRCLRGDAGIDGSDQRRISRVDVPALRSNELVGRPPGGGDPWVTYSVSSGDTGNGEFGDDQRHGDSRTRNSRPEASSFRRGRNSAWCSGPPCRRDGSGTLWTGNR